MAPPEITITHLAEQQGIPTLLLTAAAVYQLFGGACGQARTHEICVHSQLLPVARVWSRVPPEIVHLKVADQGNLAMARIRIRKAQFTSSLSSSLPRFVTKPANWLLGVAGVVVTGLLVSHMTSVLDPLLPSPARIRCIVDEWGEQNAPGTHFTILISDLAGDSHGRQTDLVEQEFEGVAGVDVFRTCHGVELDTHGSQREAKQNAARIAYELLQDWNADLLVWGAVIKEDKALRIHFLNRQGESKITLKPYLVNDSIELEEDFSKDFGNQLIVATISQLLLQSDEQYAYVAPILESRVSKLEKLLDQEAYTMTPSQLGSLYSTVGVGKALIGTQRDDIEALQASSDLLKMAAIEFQKAQDLEMWAATQIMIGGVLATQFQFDKETARLDKAITALEEAASELSRGKNSELLGLAQLQKGFLLFNRWTISNDGALATKAVAALDQAISVIDQQNTPHEWALANGMRAMILVGFGEAAQDYAQLRAAADSLRASLSVFDRDRHSQIWGMFELSLAGALSVIGQWERGTAGLQEAIEHFELALTEFDKQRSPRKSAIITIATAVTQAEVGERRGDPAWVKEAASRLQQVKGELSPARPGHDWGLVQNALGHTLAVLAELTEDAGIARDAVAAAESAVSASSRARFPSDWAAKQDTRGFALAILGRIQKDARLLKDALGAYELALEERTRTSVPMRWATTTLRKGQALIALGELTGESSDAQRAIASFSESLSVFEHAQADHYMDMATAGLNQAQSLLSDRSAAAGE